MEEEKKLAYTSWSSMKQRCFNPGSPSYKYYGERGITVCKRWLDSFENFYSDMGIRLEGLSLDRINNDGDYERGNCKWSTPKEQSNNRRIRVEGLYSEKVSTRVTPKMHKALTAKATKQNRTLSSYVKILFIKDVGK